MISGQLTRCPKCKAVFGSELLDVEDNLCRVCGHRFAAVEAIFEDYGGRKEPRPLAPRSPRQMPLKFG